MKILIKNVRLVDANLDVYGDILIDQGIIKKIGQDLNEDCTIIDGKNKVLMPGFIDTHAHFRYPGLTYKEDLESGSKAAAKGGFTTVNLMPNTKPVCSKMEIVFDVLENIKKIGLINAHQCISLTNNFLGDDISHLDLIDTNVVKIITEDGYDVYNAKVMMDVMEKAQEKGLTVMCHCEDKDLSPYDYRLAENIMTERNIALAAKYSTKLHIAHISTKEALEYVRAAKLRNEKVTCEVTAHHLCLDDKINFRVNPPLRTQKDIAALIEGIKNGTVDCIGTDHAPHSKEDKLNGAPGLSAIEYAFSVIYTVLNKNCISLNKISEILSKNAAKLLQLNTGELIIGKQADLVLVDLDREIIIDSNNFVSKGKVTPFEQMKFKGEILMTICNGKIVYKK